MSVKRRSDSCGGVRTRLPANGPQTFKKRALEIADKAQNTRTVQQEGDGNDFMTGLDETERHRKYRMHTDAFFFAVY